MKQLIYLAVPYSHPNPQVRQWRFEQANKAAAKLMAVGFFVISPISHTHPIAMAGRLPLDWKFWRDYDTAILECCRKIIVLKIPGWNKSKGIAGELRIARKLKLQIEYIEP